MKHRIRTTSKQDHKLAQLCAQVEEIVSLALGDAADPRLHELFVQTVLPGPDAARLLVVLSTGEPTDMHQLDEIHAALDGARSWLRQQVAAEIHRKRTPDLAFRVLPLLGESQ